MCRQYHTHVSRCTSESGHQTTFSRLSWAGVSVFYNMISMQCRARSALHQQRSRTSLPGHVRKAPCVLLRVLQRDDAFHDGRTTDELLSDQASALARSLSDLSKLTGRECKGTHMILAADNSLAAWKRLDDKVNKYPVQRSFTAIGTGEQGFRDAMVGAVEQVVGVVHTECVSQRSSSKGQYLSVTVGPVWVRNSDEVIAVYSLMKSDGRLKWVL